MGATSRENKGRSLIEFPGNYVAVDLETTGTSPRWDRIIEVGAVRVKDGKPAATFQELINPGFEISFFVEELTGITNGMLASAREEKQVMNAFMDFIAADDVLVGHSIASFDSNFLYDAGERIGITVANDFVDTMRIARKLHAGWEHHRLRDLTDHFGIANKDAHRALADAQATHECFEIMRGEAAESAGSIEAFCTTARKKTARPAFDWGEIKPTVEEFDETHPFYGKEVAVTGSVGGGWTQKDVAQAVVNCGGTFVDKLKKKTTNFLIVGDYSKCRELNGKPSSKHVTALKMQQEGKDITILSPDSFFDLVTD